MSSYNGKNDEIELVSSFIIIVVTIILYSSVVGYHIIVHPIALHADGSMDLYAVCVFG